MSAKQLRILAVDISNLFRRGWEAAQGKDFSEAYNRTLAAVARFREGHDRVAICCDGPRSFRKSISAEYKANRTDPGEAYREQLRRTIERLAADGCAVFHAPPCEDGHAEADDIIGSLCKWAREMGHSVSILSADKDVLQCVTSAQDEPKVCRITPDRGDVQFAEWVQENLGGLVPTQIADWLALCGDKGDGYKPYHGLGEKGAAALLRARGDIASVLLHTEEKEIAQLLKDAPLAARMKEAGPDPAFIALKLATLRCDLPLDFDALTAEPVAKPLSEPAQQPFAQPAPPTAPPAAAAVVPAAAPQRDPIKTQALTLAKQPNQIDRTALQPRTLRQLGELARVVVDSRMFPNITSQEQAYVVMHMANEHGVAAMTAMMHAYFVRGRLSWSAQYIAGLCLRATDLCEVLEVVETNEDFCKIRYKRTGRPAGEYTVTFPEAQKRGWVKGGSKWQEDPRTMLRWCAYRECCRFVWPEIVGGLYTPDELRDGQPTDAEFMTAEAA